MKKLTILAAAAGLLALGACNNTPQEQAADKIESNTEAMADNMEDMADGAATENAEDALENQADMTREMGQNQAEDMRTNDADTNLSNGM